MALTEPWARPRHWGPIHLLLDKCLCVCVCVTLTEHRVPCGGCTGAVSLLVSLQSPALQDQGCPTGPYPRKHELHHCLVLASCCPQAPRAQHPPEHVPLWNQGWKAWIWSLTSWGGGTSPGQGGLWTPLPYCLGSCSLFRRGHLCFLPRPPALSTPDVAVLSPRSQARLCPQEGTHQHGGWDRGCGDGHRISAGNRLGHTCPATGEALVEGAQGGLYHAACSAPARRAHNRATAPHRPPPPPSSPARPGRAHGRRLC